MIVYDEQRRALDLGTAVGRGGEAIVYRIASQPNRLAKIYEPAPRPDYAAKLGWMIAHPPANPTREQSHPALAWPDGLLFDVQGHLRGYGMPFIRRTTPILDVFNPRRRAEVMPPYFDRRYLHRVARNLSAALNALHRSGYVAGDLNESNILVTHTALVALIDTDSFQVTAEIANGSRTYPCPVGKLEYTAPELQGQRLADVVRRPEQDSFGLAVLIFQLLMEGNHPFRAQWLAAGEPPPLEKRIAQGAFPYTASPSAPVLPPRNAPELNVLNPWLAELLRRCFLDGHRNPALRPTPETWRNAIIEAEQHLLNCPFGHYYSDHLRACPTCAAREAAGRPASTPARSGTGQAGDGKAQQRAVPAAGKPSTAGNMPAAGSMSAAGTPAAKTQPAQPSASAVPGAKAVGANRTVPSAPGRPANATGSAASAGKVSTTGRTPAAGNSSAVNNRVPGGFGSVPAAQSGPVFQQSRAAGRVIWRLRQSAAGGSSAGSSSAAAPWLRVPGGAPVGWGRQPGAWVRAVPRLSPRDWLRQLLSRSLLVGGPYGALTGLIPGMLLGLTTGTISDSLPWTLLFALGGAFAGAARGWQPGYRLASLIERWIGWRRFWRGLGIVTGGILGLAIGMVFAVAVFPVILGPLVGGRAGASLGEKLWRSGSAVGWERIWAVLGALLTAGLGWVIAGLVGASGVSDLGPNLALALESGGVRPLLTAILAGGFCSALGGLSAGILADLVSGLLGLAD